jgi:hypothetical protein
LRHSVKHPVKFFNAHLTTRLSTPGESFFKKLFGHLFQRQTLGAGLGHKARLSLRVELDPDGHWK